jgi:hypothetical protein
MNYSPPSQAPLAAATPPALYTALSAFAAGFARSTRVLYHRLREGRAILFDNQGVWVRGRRVVRYGLLPPHV